MHGVSRRCNDEPPEAVLQGLAMAGLVGILRQLGDLAELAADVFQDLHDQVMDASARGRRLAARAKQLEDGLHPLIDREDFLAAQAHPDTERMRWHVDPKVSQGVVAGAGMPSFIAEYIKHCRGPPGLSILDKYDAVGDGACLRRYTNPSLFRINYVKLYQQDTPRGKKNRPKFQSSEDDKIPKPAAHTYASILSFRSETDISETASSPRFLSMLRLLKHRQTSGGSVSSSLSKPQLHQNIQKFESKENYSSVDHSEVDISVTSSPPDHYIAVDISTTTEKVKENKDSAMPCCSDAGSDYGEQRGELGRTSSFEAWLSQDFPTPDHDITEDSYHDTSNGLFSHGIQISSDVAHCATMKAKQDSVTEEMSENSCSEDADVVIPPLPPIPPMQWLSDKVRTRPIVHRKSLGKHHHKPSNGNILKTPEFPDLAVHSDEPWSEPACRDPRLEAETCSRQETRPQNFMGHGMQVPERPLMEDSEDNSAADGSRVSTSEVTKDDGNAAQVDLQNESVAVQELVAPPSVPRPKHSLLGVGSHNGIKKRSRCDLSFKESPGQKKRTTSATDDALQCPREYMERTREWQPFCRGLTRFVSRLRRTVRMA